MQLQNQNINTNETREAREEAASRHKDISSSLLSELHYWLGFLDDLLSCEIRHWNARLCEYVMSEVIVGTVLLNWNQSLVVLEDGGTSLKTSEEVKAKAEIRTSVQFITLFLGMVEHVSPLLVFFFDFLVYIDSLSLLSSAPFGKNDNSSITL